MLVNTPNALYGRIGAVLSALIVVFCVIGLTMHKEFYAGKKRAGFLCFYTNLSNLLVGIYFGLIAPYLYARSSLHFLIPHAEFFLMLSIMLTFSVFHTLLFPSLRIAVNRARHNREFFIVCIDNTIVHYLVPWLVLLYWLLCSPGKAYLGFADAVIWTLFPLIYLIMIYIRAAKGKIIEETQSLYPYPFLDIGILGKKTVLRTCAILYGVCAAAGAGIVLFTKLLFLIFGGGHAVMLI